MPLKHSRKRNVGIIYESLVRLVAERTLAGDGEGVREATGVIRRHFGAGALAAELGLFSAVRRARSSSRAVRERTLGEIVSRASSLPAVDGRQALIRELNQRFGVGFLGRYRIPDYRALASLQIVIDDARGRSRQAPDELAALHEAIVSHGDEASPVSAVDPDRDSVAYRIGVKKFGERHGALNEAQRGLIGAHVRASLSRDRSAFRSLVERRQRDIHALIRERLAMDSELRADPVLVERLSAAQRRIRDLDPHGDPDSTLDQMVLFEDLAKELIS